MKIIINGKSADVDDFITIGELLTLRNLNIDHVVVEVNEAIVPRENFGSYRFAANDSVEILRFVGGG
jgi:sulfur carrier protein